MTFLLAFLSGVLSAVPMIFPRVGFLLWVTIAPLMTLCLLRRPLYRYGLLWSIGFYGVLYYWFTCLYPMDFAGFDKIMSIAVVAIAWIGMTLLQALPLGLNVLSLRLAGVGSQPPKTKKRKTSTAKIHTAADSADGNPPASCAGSPPYTAKEAGTDDSAGNLGPDIKPKRLPLWLLPFLWAAVWTLLEWMQTQTWLGVPFFRLAISQTSLLPVIQSASLFGSLFTGFLIVLVNGFLGIALAEVWHFVRLKRNGLPSAQNVSSRRIRIASGAAALIFALNFLYGALAMILYTEKGDKIPVALIQGNISSGDKWADNSVRHSTELYISLTDEASAHCSPAIVIWPETVINVNLSVFPELRQMISDCAVRNHTMILCGTFARTGSGTDSATYNAILPFYPDGSVGDSPYYKRHLVPFGEYLPMETIIRAVLPVLAEMNVFSDSLTPGADSALLSSDYGKIGCLICFDSIYPDLTLSSVRDGAGLIALSTNDSWYRDSAAVYQHNRHAVLRAVETRRYVLRAANTGISSITAPDGRVTASLGALKQGYVCGEAVFSESRTLYSYIGDTFVILCAIFFAGTAAAAIRHHRLGKRDG